jgi:hypothetical protein
LLPGCPALDGTEQAAAARRSSLIMREGVFEAFLVRENGTRFPERRVQGVDYVVSEPGHVFQLSTIVHKDKRAHPSIKRVQTAVKIDGNSVGYVKNTDTGKATTFKGYRVGKSEVMRQFVFALPNMVEGKPPVELTKDSNPLGTIVVEFYESIPLGPLKTPAKVAASNGNDSLVLPATKVFEDKKFYEQASTVTAAGAKVEDKLNFSHADKAGRLLHRMTIR